MGPPKRKHARQAPQMRSRTTRSRGKPIVTNPEENSQMLDAQLRQLGLYAAHTIGDGNCLFRALSDQLYGTPSHHLKLRQDICDWIESHKERYAPFVEDERGLEHHLSCMRQQATYGGHLELSAFAHMTKRNVKVIQPGLVYVIEWDAGGDFTDEVSQAESSTPREDSTLDSREKRRQRRERLRSASEKSTSDDVEVSTTQGTVYVAYHDWEHFSSIRNLRGPHTGLPNVVEMPAPDEEPPSSPSKKPASKVKAKPVKAPKREAKKTVASVLAQSEHDTLPPTPSQIPLPGSASPSPPPSTAPSSRVSAFPGVSSLEPHSYRSPKRTFDESSASSQAASESSQSAAKRAKSSSRPASTLNTESPALSALAGKDLSMDTDDMDTPDLSATGSSAESVSSLSSLSSPEPTPPPPDPPAEKPLTRRQRKRLGLPKPRAASVARTTARTRSAGKIVIPGGKFQKSGSKPVAGETSEEDREANAEWRKNGTGRLDVRGFRELKI
ncbi:cysteine proteinase [Pilatotrama ljubarskyi]|nr:cysteine proteinase [Pilatotrama ljubarskyi]